mmetsp:Transcript_31672/g.51245  ORF Transcript_31672/g.51245 Transcript_31672/m.51245 type:complete len:117 (+) Transcript_31672:193-543(+)
MEANGAVFRFDMSMYFPFIATKIWSSLDEFGKRLESCCMRISPSINLRIQTLLLNMDSLVEIVIVIIAWRLRIILRARSNKRMMPPLNVDHNEELLYIMLMITKEIDLFEFCGISI